jgi:hypothetical protein
MTLLAIPSNVWFYYWDKNAFDQGKKFIKKSLYLMTAHQIFLKIAGVVITLLSVHGQKEW